MYSEQTVEASSKYCAVYSVCSGSRSVRRLVGRAHTSSSDRRIMERARIRQQGGEKRWRRRGPRAAPEELESAADDDDDDDDAALQENVDTQAEQCARWLAR